MENAALKRFGKSNFNNMTDEQLHNWPLSFLTEAQRENYVNQNLEIVRHYRTEALSRPPVYDIEQNAIDAAIARHGLYMSSSNVVGRQSTNANTNTEETTAPTAIVQQQAAAATAVQQQAEEVVVPPPARRPRMEEQQSGEHSACTSSSSNGHYVTLAHIFSEAYVIRIEPDANIANNNTNSNSNNNPNIVSNIQIANANNVSNANPNDQESEMNAVIMKETIDNLGLRRSS